MKANNQGQYKMKIIRIPNQSNNVISPNQSNIYQSHPNQQISTQKSPYYTSGRAIQQSDQNSGNIYSSKRQEPQASKYSLISQQSNQRYAPQNTSNQRVEKKIYVNRGNGINEGFKNKQIGNNNINNRTGVASLISSADNYSNKINMNKAQATKIIKFPLQKPYGNRENIRGRKIENSNQDRTRAKSYLSERKSKNRFISPEKSLLKEKRTPFSVEYKRKTIYRGGEYNNIQITHIISTIKPNIDKYDFHIFETLSRVELDKKPLDLTKIKTQIRPDHTAKSSYKSSCDGRVITPIVKDRAPKTTIYQHAAGIGMTDLAPDMINSNLYKSGLLKMTKKKKPKGEPVTQIIEVFRSQQSPSSNFTDAKNKSINDKYNTNNALNKTNYNSYNPRMNTSINSSNLISISYNTNQKPDNKEIIKKEYDQRYLNQYNKNNDSVNKNNNLSNYYSSISINNKSNINKKSNIITSDIKPNNKEIITSPNSINQSNYNKGNYNTPYNIRIGNRDNLKPLTGSEMSPIKKLDKYNFSNKKETKPVLTNNIYTKTEPNGDIKNRIIIGQKISNISANNNLGKSSKNIPTESSINYSSRQNIKSPFNYQQNEKNSNINTSKNADNKSLYNTTQSFYSGNRNSQINKNYDTNQKYDRNKTSNIYTDINKYNNYNKAMNNQIYSNSPSKNNISINNSQSGSNLRRESSNKSPPKTNTINLKKSSYIKYNITSPNKLEINLDKEKDINKIYNNKSYLRTDPITNVNINRSQQIPSKISISQKYGGNQNSNMTNTFNKQSPSKAYNPSNGPNKQTPQKIYINTSYNNQNSNNKNIKQSQQKPNINSTNYNVTKTSYNRSNQKSPPKININERYNNKEMPYNKSTKISINLEQDSNQFNNSRYKKNQDINPKEDLNKNYNNIKPSNLFNKNNYENKYNNNKIPKEEEKIKIINTRDNKDKNKLYFSSNYLSPSHKPENKPLINYVRLSPKKEDNISDKYISPSKVENRQQNNYTRPSTKIEYNQRDNYVRPITKIENKSANNYFSPTTRIENKPQNYTHQTNITENKPQKNYSRPTTKVENNLQYNYSSPIAKKENPQPNKYVRPTTKPEKNLADYNSSQTNKVEYNRQNNYTSQISKIEKKQVDNNSYPTTKIEYKRPDNYSRPVTKIETSQPYNYARPITKIQTNQSDNNVTPTTKNETKISDNYSRPTTKIETKPKEIYIRPTNKVETKKTENYSYPTTTIVYKRPEYSNRNNQPTADNITNITPIKNEDMNELRNSVASPEDKINIKTKTYLDNKPNVHQSSIASEQKSNIDKNLLEDNKINDNQDKVNNLKHPNIANENINNNSLSNLTSIITQKPEDIFDSNNVNIPSNNVNYNNIKPTINKEEKLDKKEETQEKNICKSTDINKNENINPIQELKTLEDIIIPEKQKENEIVDNIRPKKENIINIEDKNVKKDSYEISPKIVSKITDEYFKHEKMPQTLEGWQELKHIFKKWKNLINNKEESIKNPKYVAWFRRNCNDNSPEPTKIDKINDFLHLDLDVNDENSPTRINNYIERMKKIKDSHEQMPYDEWFNKHCEKPSISSKSFILPFEQKYIPNKDNKKEEESLICLKDILEPKGASDDNLTNEEKEKNKNSSYNEKEMKYIYNFINGLKNNKQKKKTLSTLKNIVDNEVKRNQINKLNNFIERKMKKEGINKIIEKSKNPKKKEILNNIVDLWDSKNEKEEKEFFDNVEHHTLELMPKEEQKKKINDMFNEKENINEDKQKSINKLVDIMNKFDKERKHEILEYLRENNKTPNKEEKLTTLNDILTNKEKEKGLIKIFGGNNIKENKDKKQNKERISQIIDNLNVLDNASKSNILKYMKDTAEDNEEKNKDLDVILNNVKLEEDNNNSFNSSVYAYDGSYIEGMKYDKMRYSSDLSDNRDENEKALSVTEASLREEEINIDDLNYSNSDLKSIDNLSVFNNDDELIDAVNDIEEEKKSPKKKLDNDEFNFVINGMLDDLLQNKDIQKVEDKEKKENKEEKEKEEKEKIDNAVNSIKQLNKDDQVKVIYTLNNISDNDEKKKKIVNNLHNNLKKYWNTQKLIKDILDKQKKEEQEENAQKEKEKEKEKIENNEKEEEVVIERLSFCLLENVLTGESDLNNNNYYDYNNPNDDLKNTKEQEKDENENITFIEKERIDKAAETLNDLEKGEQNKIITKLRGRVKKPKEKLKLDKLLSTLDYMRKMKELTKKIKKKPIISKEKKKNDDKEEIKKDETESLPQEELNELIEGFLSDLYKPKEDEPKTRAEKRELDKKNEEKLKNVAKAINSLNKNDKKIALQKLKNNIDDDTKKENFNKLDNLLNNTNNLKSYIKKLINEKINEDKISADNKNNELDKNDLDNLNRGFNEELFPEEKDIKNTIKLSDKYLDRINERKIDKAVDLIKDLNSSQKKQVLENIRDKAAEEKNLEKFKIIITKLKNIQKINNVINKLSEMQSKKDKDKEEEQKKQEFEKKEREDNEKEKQKEEKEEIKPLKDEDFINVTESVINYLYDDQKYEPVNKVDKYINEKEKTENVDKAADMIKNLNDEDKDNMVKILNENADNNEKKKIVSCFKKKVKETKKKKTKKYDKKITKEKQDEVDFNYQLIKAFNNRTLTNEKGELNDDLLGNMTNQLIGDLLENKEHPEEDSIQEEKTINKVANVIKDLNKNDQAKVIKSLKDSANDDETKKQKVEKVNNLVNNMNGIHSYLKGIIRKRVKEEHKEEELEKDKLNDLINNIMNDLFQEPIKFEEDKNNKTKEETEDDLALTEEKMQNIANFINNLHENDKNKVLKALEENAKNEKNQEILANLRKKMKKINQINILVNNMKIKKDEIKKEKPKLSDEDINKIAYEYSSDLYYKEKEPSSSLESFMMKENEKNKINDIADSMKTLDKDDQDKALKIISDNAINEIQKEKAKKLTNLVKNINNMKSFFGKMIKDKINKEEKDEKLKEKEKETENNQELIFEGDLHENEIEELTNSYWSDLDKSKKNKINKIGDITNNFANILNELKIGDKEKAVTLLRVKSQKENDNKEEINKLEKKLNELNDMKPEIESYKKSLFSNENKYPLEDKEIENNCEQIFFPNEENPEIIIEELEPMKLQELADDFCAELNNEEIPKEEKSIKIRGRKKSKEDNLKVDNIANIVTKLKENDQKKILDDLEKKVKNENYPKLIKKVEANNKIKNISQKIKERNDKRKEEHKIKEENIKSLYENNENLPEEKLQNIADTIITDIFDSKTPDMIKEDKPIINKESMNDIIKEDKIKNYAKILNNLNNNDKQIVLEKIKKYSSEKENGTKKIEYINKLQRFLNKLDKMKTYDQRVKEKINKINLNENINKSKSVHVPKKDEQVIINKLIENLYEKQEEDKKGNEENINKVADEITDLNKDNQDDIISKLKEESNTPERKNQIPKLLSKIEKLNKMKDFGKKVKEKIALKKAKQEIKNEEEFGIVIPDNFEYNAENNEQNEVFVKKPEEMNENDLNKLTDYFISDLYEIKDDKKKEEKEKEEKDNSIEKYKRIKTIEKKMNEIADTINNLDENNKQKVLEKMKENAKTNEDKNRYNKLIQFIIKGCNQLDKLKKIVKENAIKEIEKQNLIIKENEEKNKKDILENIPLEEKELPKGEKEFVKEEKKITKEKEIKEVQKEEKDILKEEKEISKEEIKEEKEIPKEKKEVLKDKKEELIEEKIPKEEKEILNEEKEIPKEEKEIRREGEEVLKEEKEKPNEEKEVREEINEKIKEGKEMPKEKKGLVLEEKQIEKEENKIPKDEKEIEKGEKEVHKEEKEATIEVKEAPQVEKDITKEEKEVLKIEEEIKEIPKEEKEVPKEEKEKSKEEKEVPKDEIEVPKEEIKEEKELPKEEVKEIPKEEIKEEK